MDDLARMILPVIDALKFVPCEIFSYFSLLNCLLQSFTRFLLSVCHLELPLWTQIPWTSSS